MADDNEAKTDTEPVEESQEVIEPTDLDDKAHTVVTPLEKKWEEDAKVAKVANKERFGRIKDLGRAYWAKKKWTLPATVAGLVVLLLALPLTRYPILGLAISKDYQFAVMDSTTAQPVTGASVTVAGKSGNTDNHGVVTIKAKLGKHTATVSKKYYKTFASSVFVGFTQHTKPALLKVVATGRQVPITVINKITTRPIENAVVKAAGTEVKTDKNGQAVLVLPTTSTSENATVSLAGFNTLSVKVEVTDRVVSTNTFKLVTTGQLYFLSNQSGKIDVVKANLDGSGRATILAGTGTEDTYSTALLASRDWKYLALLSKRSTNTPAIYLIDTTSDKVTNIDEGNSNTSFTLVGWSGDNFVYQVSRSNVQSWQSGAQSLKGYDANAGKLYAIDQTQGEGTNITDYGFNSFSTVSILDNELVYAKNWYSSGATNHLTGKSVSLMSVHPDGSAKKSIKDFAIPASAQYGYTVGLALYQPQSIYVQVPNGDNTNTYYEYEGGKLNPKTDLTDDTFNKVYPTFLVSPTGKQTFWSDQRDGKNALFTGDANASGAKQIASLSDYTPYGWYTDDYLLLTKSGSELYIMPSDGSKPPVLVTNYYKPQLSFRGYGGGYGGQ